MAARSRPVAARPRISVDIDPELRRRLRLAAARRDMSIGALLLELIEGHLGDESDDVGHDALTALGDPVLAELWDNERDALYDRTA